jgi:hypothetical protein
MRLPSSVQEPRSLISKLVNEEYYTSASATNAPVLKKTSRSRMKLSGDLTA